MGSSCESSTSGVSATGPVSAATGTRLTVVAREFDASFSEVPVRTGSVFRGKFKGLSDGLSLKGCTISARPIARLHGSRGFVSTGGGRVPKRFARSARGVFFLAVLSGPATDT